MSSHRFVVVRKLVEKLTAEGFGVEIDCRRTDRNQPLFSAPADEEDISGVTASPDALPRADYAGGQPPSNAHVRKLQEILLTYNVFETELGYVQGMSDLASPIYIIMEGDAPLTFWCFAALMDRMVRPSFALFHP